MKTSYDFAGAVRNPYPEKMRASDDISIEVQALKPLLGPWCGAVVPGTENDDPDSDGLACLRDVGHLGRHVPRARDAWFADYYASTSGYRRQRRRQGYGYWGSKRWRRRVDLKEGRTPPSWALHGR